MKKEKVRCIEYKRTWGSEGWRDRIDRNLERMHLFVTIVVSHPSVIHLFGMMISAACNADQKGGPRMGGKRRVS